MFKRLPVSISWFTINIATLTGIVDETEHQDSYDYEMMEDRKFKFKSWEVARATSAAPLYFSSFTKTVDAITSPVYWDGGLFHNNPAWIACQEFSKIWPDISSTHPDLLLSVGSGHISSKKLVPREEVKSFMGKVRACFSNPLGDLKSIQSLKILRSTFLQNLNSDSLWSENFPEKSFQYFRLNPPCDINLPELDDIEMLKNGRLAEIADAYLPEASMYIGRIARRLIATSFYFEPEQPSEETEHGHLFNGRLLSLSRSCKLTYYNLGSIACRFFNGSEDLKHFLQLLKERTGVLRFKSKEANEYLGVAVTADILDKMEKDTTFRVENVSFTVPKGCDTFTIFLEADKFEKEERLISGCPWRFRRPGDL
jgi:hypothetical protein